jgi:hypothetical protein
MTSKVQGIFSPTINYEVLEASGEVDGKAVLAKVRGEFFFPDGTSRNNRHYPKPVWEKTLADENVRERLMNKRMFGTISHDQALDDQALLDGKVSHIVTALRIENGKGMGEAIIINTPAGRILDTVMRAGAKMFVSSRASGGYNGTKDGVPIVDAETYNLETFDFVMEPGFLKANPKIVEALSKEDLKESGLEEGLLDSKIPETINGDGVRNRRSTDQPGNKIPGERNMDPKETKELVESLNGQVVAANKRADEAVDALSKARGDLVTANEAKGKLETDSKAMKEKDVKQLDQIKGLESSLKHLEGLGDPAKIAAAVKQADSFTTKLEKLLIKDFKTVGEQMEFAAKVVKEFGDYARIKRVYEVADGLADDLLALGSRKEIKAALESSAKVYSLIKSRQIRERSARLANRYEVPASSVEALFKKGLSVREVKDTLKSLRESAGMSRFRNSSSRQDEGGKGGKGGKDDLPFANMSEGSSAQRLLSRVQGHRAP